MSLLASLPLAIDRVDVADYVSALFTIYLVLILIWIVISWVVSFRGSLPYNTALRAVTDFVEQCVAPYLNVFRRIMPPIGGGRMMLDLSPVIGILVLIVLQSIVVRLIAG